MSRKTDGFPVPVTAALIGPFSQGAALLICATACKLRDRSRLIRLLAALEHSLDLCGIDPPKSVGALPYELQARNLGPAPGLSRVRQPDDYASGANRIPESSSPNIKNKSHTITAMIDVPQNGSADGVLVAAGGVVGGYGLFIRDGRPTYEYNYFNVERYKIVSPEKLPPGSAKISVDFKYDGGGLGKGGIVTLFVNDQQVAQGRVDKTVPARFSADETFDIGLDTGSPISNDYESPFKFAGTIQKVVIDLEPANLSQADLQTIRKAEIKARLARE